MTRHANRHNACSRVCGLSVYSSYSFTKVCFAGLYFGFPNACIRKDSPEQDF